MNKAEVRQKLFTVALIAWIVMGLALWAKGCEAVEVDVERLADAIYKAEGGAKTAHPYGILKKYKTTTPRQACINTIKSGLRRFAKQDKEVDFIYFLSLTYCPIGASNDPKGLNNNWVRNVKYWYNKLGKEI